MPIPLLASLGLDIAQTGVSALLKGRKIKKQQKRLEQQQQQYNNAQQLNDTIASSPMVHDDSESVINQII